MPELGNVLLNLARAAIAREFGQLSPPAADLSELHEPGATFVTLIQGGQLRGCIGSLQAWRPLLEDVQDNARNAAFRDPRFPPIGDDELADLEVHISVLSPPEPIAASSEAELLERVRPGVDGLILEDKGHRGTFLPAVWESLPQPAQFLAHLKQKAGLPADHWSDSVRISRYTAEAFGD